MSKKIFYLNVFILILVIGCKPKPEFYVNDKPCIARSRCVKSHEVEKFGYHYGYSFMKGKWCWHTGYYKESICDSITIDTIFIK